MSETKFHNIGLQEIKILIANSFASNKLKASIFIPFTFWNTDGSGYRSEAGMTRLRTHEL